jgi:hypothetical protein
MTPLSGAPPKKTDAIDAPSLLRGERMPGCYGRSRTAEQRDELAADHSITSSARSRIAVGNSTPIARAVTTRLRCLEPHHASGIFAFAYSR